MLANSSLVAETRALRDGLVFAKEEHVLEIDALGVLQLIKHLTIIIWQIISLIIYCFGCRSLLEEIETVSIKPIY